MYDAEHCHFGVLMTLVSCHHIPPRHIIIIQKETYALAARSGSNQQSSIPGAIEGPIFLK